MRNKMIITAKEEQARPALVPKLRFPEFRNLRGWSPTALYVIADPVTERAIQGEEDNVLSLSTEHGIVLQSEFFGKKVAGDNSERYLKIARNDFVYNDRTTKASTFGTIKRLSKHSGGIVSPIYKCFRFHTDENPVFWEQYFESGNHDSALCGLVNEGARAGRFNISIRQFLSTAAPRPAEAEQQKIAKCLSSVDELIAAQERKVDALKTHKKGLMQQLFPREDETQPRLRFPEFQNAGEWLSGSLGSFFETTSGGTPSRTEKAYWNGDIPWITTTLVDFRVINAADEFITAEGLKNSSAKLFPKGTILLAMYGQGKTRGQVALLGIEAATNQACAAILPQNGIDPYFVFAYLAGRYDEIREISNSGGQENLSQGLVRKIHIAIPSDDAEQRTITTLMNNLDGLIGAEFDMLEALRFHKKGLMQQLFPSLESKT